jgi:general secretion pathway protein H
VPELSHQRQRGFTLLEMLVVVLLIAMLAVGALISLGATGKDSQLEKERDRLSSLIAYTRERGAMLTLEYGIRVGQHGYRFVYFDNRDHQWQPETVDDTLRARRMPPGLKIQLVIEGHQIVLDDKALLIPKTGVGAPVAGATASKLGSDQPDSFSNQVADNAPQLMLLSNGDINSFALTFVRDGVDRRVVVQSTPEGDIQAGEILEARR